MMAMGRLGWAPGAWRQAFDVRLPETRARRRLRAVVLFGTLVIGASGLVDAASRPGDDRAEAGPASPTTRPQAVPLPSAPPGMVPVITRVETTDPVVFLTIDDGVTRTPEVLDAFADAGVPATLFLVDDPVNRGSTFFRSMEGTVVEAHSQTHADLRGRSEADQRREICGSATTIETAFGRRPVLFRPPYGHYDDATRRAAHACGMKAVVLWEETVNQDTISFRHGPELRPGDIVLMHFRPEFRQELETIVERVDRAGLRFALLEDYIG
jgi:peptidoglycan/xylan/chitin deacetylase (PgdA/CDA1 family)